MTKSITGKSPRGPLAGMNFRVCAAAASSTSSSILLLLVSFSPSGFTVETNSRGRTASPTARLDAVLPFFVLLVPFRYLAWPPSRPPLAARCADGPAGPAWRREGGPSVSSPATWSPRGEGGVEGAGAEEAGQREKKQQKTDKKNSYFFSSSRFSSLCVFQFRQRLFLFSLPDLLHSTAPFSCVFVSVTYFPVFCLFCFVPFS